MKNECIPSDCRLPFLAGIGRFFTSRQEISRGVTSFCSIRFFVVLALYLASAVFLAQDAYFIRYGEFTWNQPLLVLFLACMITATVNWDLLITGKPAGANLLLQTVLVIPMALFIARILGESIDGGGTGSLWGETVDRLRILLDKILPGFLMKPFDFCVALFDNFWLLLLFVILEVALSFKSRTNKMAVLCLFIIMIFGHAIAVGHTKAFFLLGAFCLFSGFAFHFCDYSKLAFHENLIRRLPLKGDVAVYQTILRIMSVIYERGEIEERAFVQIVKSVYSEYGQFSEGDIKLLAIEINKKMLYEYSLITINATSSGYYAGPDSQLFSCSSLLQKIAVLPRMAVIFVLAILWLASPVDLIPDALPFGGLDDVVVALLSTFVIKKNIADVRQGERFR